MLRSFLRLALRLFLRQKAYAVITVGGLALAMTVGILTSTWAQYEFGFDRFHRNGRDIYRFIVDIERGRTSQKYDAAPLPLGPVLEQDFPEVRAVVRLISDRYGRAESPRTTDFDSVTCLADPAFLTMFDFPLIQGDPRTALTDPNSVVLTESAARKYFGTADPMGQSLLFLDKKAPMFVSGVMKDVPKTSHLRFDMLVPLKVIDTWYSEDSGPKIWDDWTLAAYDLYVQLAPGTDPKAFEAKVARVIGERNPKSYYRLSLQPLFQAHLYSADFNRPGLSDVRQLDVRQVRIFLLVALVVLLMACVNYTNLATARSLKRVKEIAVRKVNGAARRDIALQFIGESLIFSFVALALAVLFALSLLPAFKAISGRELDLSLVPKVPLVLSLIFTAFAAGVVSGLYPAVHVAALAPVTALRERTGSPRRSLLTLRRILVVGQIIGSAALIIVTAVFYLQLRYIRNKDLGFNPKDVMVVPFGDTDRLEAFKADVLRHPAVLDAAEGLVPALGARGHRFDGSRFAWEGKSAGANVPMDVVFVDEDYLKTFGAAMASGRFFSKDFPGDRNNFVLNESAIKALGLDDPIGKSFAIRKSQGRIIGVIKDFHLGTLRSKIAPAVFFYAPFASLSVRIDPRQTQAVIRHVEAAWKTHVKERPFTYAFLEDTIGAMYRDDRQAAGIVSLFSAISLALSLLGLFGLTAFLAEQRTKEIGVRKVLGASSGAIVRLLAAEFALLVGAAAVLAWPVAYAVTARWLNGFAYRISLAWWIFAASAAVVFAVTLMTLGGKIVGAARRNPIDSLRYE